MAYAWGFGDSALGSSGTAYTRPAPAATATAILVGLALVTAIGVLGASTTKSTDALVDEVVATVSADRNLTISLAVHRSEAVRP